jgi:hypothetical protein
MARYNCRVDANQPEIVAGLRAFGAGVLVISMVKNAFDILVAYEGKLYAMELKDGDKPPSQTKLTEGEKKCKKMLNDNRVEYYVVYSLQNAIDVLMKKNLHFL